MPLTSIVCRNLTCERSLLHRADGSAKFFQGKTSVLACVYGPASTVTRKENAEQAVVEVQFRPAASLAGEHMRQKLKSRHAVIGQHQLADALAP